MVKMVKDKNYLEQEKAWNYGELSLLTSWKDLTQKKKSILLICIFLYFRYMKIFMSHKTYLTWIKKQNIANLWEENTMFEVTEELNIDHIIIKQKLKT